MAPHSSTLAWKIAWAEEPGRLQSMGSLRVRHNSATKPLPLEYWYYFEASRKYSVVNNSQRCKVGNDIAFQINEDS